MDCNLMTTIVLPVRQALAREAANRFIRGALLIEKRAARALDRADAPAGMPSVSGAISG
jgi:hypothetical protein